MPQGLLLECSYEQNLIAILDNFTVVEKKVFSMGEKTSPQIFSFLEKNTPHLDYIALGIGPGSYTGVRACLTIAKSLSYISKVPLISFTSFSAYVIDCEEEFLSIFDAKMGGVYLAKGKQVEDIFVFDEAQFYPLIDAEPLVKKAKIIFSPHKEILEKKLPSSLWVSTSINVKALERLCKKKFTSKKFDTLAKLKPIYLR